MPKDPRRIWITRAEPGAAETARRVREMGLEPVVAPLLEVHTLSHSALDLRDVAALAFTSVNGVRAFAAAEPSRGLPVFAVGETTARAARQAGFGSVTSTNGDVGALAKGIASRAADMSGVILHPGAAEPAGDLAGDLRALGLAARSLALYETRICDPGPALIGALPDLEAALVHSPRAGRALAAFLRDHPAPNLRLLGISAAALQPLDETPCAGREAAAFPLEAELLNLLGS
jgi:uroporphyrinogen-III synthase